MGDMKNSSRLGMGEKLSYSLGDCAGQIYVTLASFFLTGYYTDTVGISALAVGTMMLAARIFDGTTDLIMGAIVDKTRSRHGKARAWILWTAPFMALALIALFWVPASLGEKGKLVYAYGTYILLNCIIYTANGIAYNSLLARMTLDVQDRCQASSLRFVLGNITALLVNGVTAALVGRLGWHRLILIYGAAELVLLLICFGGCREHIGEGEKEIRVPERIPLKKALSALGRNPYFFLQALMMIFLYINIMSVGSMTYYFCNTVLGSLEVMTVVTTVYSVPTIIGSLINPVLTGRLGKRRVLILCFLVSAAGRCLVGLGGTALAPVLLGVALHGLALGPVYANVFAMTPDIVDYGEWKTGIRSEGLVTCCVSFGMKVGIGVGGAVAAWVLALGGYEGTAAVQSGAAQEAIRFGFGYLSAALSVVCLVIMVFMDLDKEMEVIQRELGEKHRGK